MGFWDGFQSDIYIDDGTPIAYGSLAASVLDTFGIPHIVEDGGSLANIDIKRADAMSVLKASLLEGSADEDTLVEIAVDEFGIAYTYHVGTYISDLDVYYSIPSKTHVSDDVGVMVTGGKPKIKRKVFPWFSIFDEDAIIWHAGHLATGCLLEGINSLAVITYKDPLLKTGNASYNNGIPEMFEVESPHESIVGFAWQIVPPEGLMDSKTRIFHQNQASVPVLIGTGGEAVIPPAPSPFKLGKGGMSPNIGKLVRRKAVVDADNSACFVFEGEDRSCGEEALDIVIPKIDGLTYKSERGVAVSTLLGVNAVYVVAIDLTACRGIRKPGGDITDDSSENTLTFISSNDALPKVRRLSSGEEYIIIYKPEFDAGFCIQFANNSMYNDNAVFGTDVPFYVDVEATELAGLFDGGSGIPDGGLGLVGQGTLLPVKNDGSGLLIKEVWLQLDLDVPCFVINDPNGNASEIAEQLQVYVTAISVIDEPAPIAVNGVLVDMDESIPDNDPTTVQSFFNTSYELAMEEMSAGRTLSINLASLDKAGVSALSGKLYEILKADNGVIYNHVCGPTSDPSLGAKGPNGGIINEISYDYTDSGSYLISVVEGPVNYGDYVGLSGGLYYKKVETVNATGTIIQDAGNHIYYKVRVDGYGDIMAINSYPGLLDVRDRVNVTIYNNEVED